MTLHEHGVSDGDMLLLAAARAQASATVPGDLYRSVIAASAPAGADDAVPRLLAAATCVWAAGAGALALVWAGAPPASHRAVVAAVAAVVAGMGALLAARGTPDPLPALALGVTATVLATVAGFLAVPSGPAPPNFFLAAAVCVAISVVLLTVSAHGMTCFIAIAAFSAMAATAAGGAVIWPGPRTVVGAGLAAVSLALMGLAAKLAIAVTGLSPAAPMVDGELDEALPTAECDARARRGHQVLTGLLTGFSVSAAAGAVLVATEHRPGNPLSGVALTAAVSLALLLRTRQQRGMTRSSAVFGAGIVSAAAAFAIAVRSAPAYAHWFGLIAVAVGVGAVWLTMPGFTGRLSPVARRVVDLLDYLAVAAVVPLACWVADVFGIVRGLSLT